ncbi:MAG: hydroxymethylbilane synthase [Candidatus Riflebacteria bacterium]|nr:hydroxymethylbilane synthase [Candidatus Riflebacteria bacterium]
MNRIRIGTRGSKLALTQTKKISAIIADNFPDINIEEIIIKTRGDIIQDVPLHQIGGRGVFIKDIEEALLSRKIDIAVHSLKDMPGKLPEELCIGAISQRADPRDVLITRRSFSDISELKNEKSFHVATSSLRRRNQLKILFPHFSFSDIRGNVDTRLRKMNESMLDGIMLAAAGIDRLAISGINTLRFPIEDIIPAPGQGFLAVECRRKDYDELAPVFQMIEDREARIIADTERSFLKTMDAGCQAALAAFGRISCQKINFFAYLSDPDGKSFLRESASFEMNEGIIGAESLAKKMIESGAAQLLTKRLETE